MSPVTVLFAVFVLSLIMIITLFYFVGLNAQGHDSNRQRDHSKGEKKSREPESFAATPGFIRLLIRRHITFLYAAGKIEKWEMAISIKNREREEGGAAFFRSRLLLSIYVYVFVQDNG